MLQQKIASPGHGILAMDKSNATCGKRLDSIGLENTEQNRQVMAASALQLWLLSSNFRLQPSPFETVLGWVAAVLYLSCSMCMQRCLSLKSVLFAGIPRAALHNPRSGPVHLWSHLVRGDPVPEHHHWLHHGGRAQQAGHRARCAASHASSCMQAALLFCFFSTVYCKHTGSFVERSKKLQMKVGD